jgi:hypothetical protein
MAADAEVLPSDPAPTRELSLLGTYPVNLRRCAVEVSLRFLGITPLRVRFAAVTGELVVSDAAGAPVAALRLEVPGIPTRASIPLANRLLRSAIPGGYRLVITLAAIELSCGSAPMHADGTVSAKPLAQLTDPTSAGQEPERAVTPAVSWPLCSVVRSIQPAESSETDVILLAVRGRLRQPRQSRKSSSFLSLLRPWIRVESAAEFTR